MISGRRREFLFVLSKKYFYAHFLHQLKINVRILGADLAVGTNNSAQILKQSENGA
jgi:hypothetical protein